MASFEVEEILLTFSNGNVKYFISTTHYRENELGIPKKINEKRVMSLGMVYQFRVFFKGLSLKKKSSMDQNFISGTTVLQDRTSRSRELGKN